LVDRAEKLLFLPNGRNARQAAIATSFVAKAVKTFGRISSKMGESLDGLSI